MSRDRYYKIDDSKKNSDIKTFFSNLNKLEKRVDQLEKSMIITLEQSGITRERQKEKQEENMKEILKDLHLWLINYFDFQEKDYSMDPSLVETAKAKTQSIEATLSNCMRWISTYGKQKLLQSLLSDIAKLREDLFSKSKYVPPSL